MHYMSQSMNILIDLGCQVCNGVSVCLVCVSVCPVCPGVLGVPCLSGMLHCVGVYCEVCGLLARGVG